MNTLARIENEVPLAPLTTLGVGGSARKLWRIGSVEEARKAVDWWLGTPEAQRLPLLALGGGSNLLVSDSGFPGIVLKMENRERDVTLDGAVVTVRVGAGTVWDEFVEDTVLQGWAGVECLSGIPGSVGASPVQNIGAYGQEVAETIRLVEGIDLHTGKSFSYTNSECQFAYRDSHFKRSKGRYLITSVTFELRVDGTPTIRYRDLQERVKEQEITTLTELRKLVIEIRKSKSMVYDPSDPNYRSAGSFFTNPIVSQETADRIRASLPKGTELVSFAAGPGRVKLSAAWLIAQSGFSKGYKIHPDARAGLSTNHVLALTNRGGAKTADLLELCGHVQQVVSDRFDIELTPEPIFVGF